MEITNGIHVTKSKQGEVYSNILGPYIKFDNQDDVVDLLNLYHIGRSRYSDEAKLNAAIKIKTSICERHSVKSANTELDARQQELKLRNGLNNLINFFTEFNFEPNFRFVNTLSRMIQTSKDDAKNYIKNYFALTDNNYSNSIIEKMRSKEFEDILDDLSVSNTNVVINKRFKLYYGSQGTGKTTKALEETNGNVMLCHSALLPSDLMEDFKFTDGKATFNPSALCNAMTEGKAIVLDEINLLPFESLRFLQSLLDGKTQFEYKGQTINIADGFKIIGTMNLQVNGMTYALPEPLVDRASELKEFKLTADSLLSAIM